MRDWYLCLQNSVIGPVSESTLKGLIQAKRVFSEDLVRKSEREPWTEIAKTPGLANLLEPPAIQRISLSGKFSLSAQQNAKVIALSEKSVFIATPSITLPAGELSFDLDCPDLGSSLRLFGVALSTANSGELEISFTRVNPAHRRLIRAFLSQRDKNGKAA